MIKIFIPQSSTTIKLIINKYKIHVYNSFPSLREASTRKPVQFEESGKNLLFSNVFNEKAMKQYLTSDALKGVQSAVQHGTKLIEN
jgi:hypothetical protein